MDMRDPFLNLSPLDHRYWQANRMLFEALSETLSEKAAVRYCVRCETALLKAHIHSHFDDDPALLTSISSLEETITPEEVNKEEEVTQHNIRALVNVIQRHVPKKLAPWVHLGATSVDILDTSMAMRIRDAMMGTVLPLVFNLLDSLIVLSDRNADIPQVGRTHGQLAVPITFGFAIAEYVSRIGQSMIRLCHLSRSLRGKLAGAVGAYNAASLITGSPQKLEKDFLDELGLKPADYANQIVEPEHLLRLLLEMNVCFGIIANLADDLRHLQRSEIAEVHETFGSGQVGSSTMPQKRNPWNCEHVKSLWKAFSPRIMSFYMDQISEHQRDLSNSASGRFITDYIAGFSAAISRMKQVIDGLKISRERMQVNLSSLGDSVLAEPTYILLALSGYADAHEIVRRTTLEADSSGHSMKDILSKDSAIWEALDMKLREVLGMNAGEFYSTPAAYNGIAEEKTRQITHKYRQILADVRKDAGD